MQRLLADQQVAVAAPHPADGVFDHPDDLRAVGRGQPVAPALGPHIRIKQGGGEIAVGRLLLMTVKCPQHQDHAAALLFGQGRDDWAHRHIRQAMPEAKDSFDPLRHVHIEWDNGGDRSRRVRFWKNPYPLLVARLPPQDVTTVAAFHGE